jgi:hypothetical protein
MVLVRNHSASSLAGRKELGARTRKPNQVSHPERRQPQSTLHEFWRGAQTETPVRDERSVVAARSRITMTGIRA